MKKIIAMLLALVLALSLVACSNPGGQNPTTPGPADSKDPVQQTETIKLGLIAPMTGAGATNGTTLKWVAEWITNYVNENGGIKNLGGAKIELLVGDSQGNADIGLTEYERLVNKENVNALMGVYNSPVAMALAPRCIADRVPIVVSNATTDAIYNTPNDYVYHANLTANVWLKGCADHLSLLHKASGKSEFKLAFVYEAGNYGQSDYQTMADNMAAMGIDEIIPISIDANTADFASVVTQIKNMADEISFVMIAVGENNATLFTRQMKEYDCNVPIVADGGGFMDGVYLQNNPGDCEYILSTSNYPLALATASYDPELAESIMAEFEKDMGYTWLEPGSLFWANMWALIDALERAASSSREDIAAALKATDIKDEDNHMAELLGPSKNISFTTVELFGVKVYNQVADCSNFMVQVKDGKYEVVSPAGYETTELVFPVPNWSDK